jgi:hypothetical protein
MSYTHILGILLSPHNNRRGQETSFSEGVRVTVILASRNILFIDPWLLLTQKNVSTQQVGCIRLLPSVLGSIAPPATTPSSSPPYPLHYQQDGSCYNPAYKTPHLQIKQSYRPASEKSSSASARKVSRIPREGEFRGGQDCLFSSSLEPAGPE